IDISNLKKSFATAISFSMKLATVWASSGVIQKEKLQKLVFPDGISYNLKNEAFRTEKINTIFQPIASLAMVSGENETGQTEIKFDLSSYVGMTGFEPATPSSRT